MSITLTKSGLKVEPLDNYYKTTVSKPIPDPDFLLLVVSPKGGGKTTLVLNLLNYYNKVFSAIYIFSATVKFDLKYKPLLDKIDESKEKKVFDVFKPEVVDKLMKRNGDEKAKDHVLILYDDMIR
jgi:predicted AAA+ superfamily ATPase